MVFETQGFQIPVKIPKNTVDRLDNCRTNPELMMDNVNDLNGIVETIRELEESSCRQKDINTELKENVADLKADLEDLQNLHRQNQRRWDDNDTKIQSLQGENNNLQSCVRSRDKEIKEFHLVYREMDNAQEENESLQDNLRQLQSKMNTMKQNLSEKEESAKEYDFTIKKLENSLQEIQQRMVEYRSNVEDLGRDNECVINIWETCKKQANETNLENSRLLEKYRQIELAIHKASDTNEKNLAQVRQLKNEVNKEETKNSKLQKKVNTMMEDERHLNGKMMQLKEEIMMLHEDLDHYTSELKECRDMLKKKTEEFDNYKDFIADIKKKIVTNQNNTTARCSIVMNSHRSSQISENQSKCRSRGRVPVCKSSVMRKIPEFQGKGDLCPGTQYFGKISDSSTQSTRWTGRDSGHNRSLRQSICQSPSSLLSKVSPFQGRQRPLSVSHVTTFPSALSRNRKLFSITDNQV